MTRGGGGKWSEGEGEGGERGDRGRRMRERVSKSLHDGREGLAQTGAVSRHLPRAECHFRAPPKLDGCWAVPTHADAFPAWAQCGRCGK